MKKECQTLLDQTLVQGLDSEEGIIWQNHCKTCEDCSADLFIIKSLEQQASEDRRHLRSNDVAELLSTLEAEVNIKQATKKSSIFTNQYFKIASIIVALFSISQLFIAISNFNHHTPLEKIVPTPKSLQYPSPIANNKEETTSFLFVDQCLQNIKQKIQEATITIQNSAENPDEITF